MFASVRHSMDSYQMQSSLHQDVSCLIVFGVIDSRIYYGFSAHSLITIWCIVWLTWNTMNIGLRIWTHSDNTPQYVTPQQTICFGFIVFITDLCRVCTVRVLLMSLLQRRIITLITHSSNTISMLFSGHLWHFVL
eukprot:592357_1